MAFFITFKNDARVWTVFRDFTMFVCWCIITNISYNGALSSYNGNGGTNLSGVNSLI